VVASRSAGVVSVALQLPEGGRLMDKFPSDTTLWRILRKFESAEGRNLNFTARGVTQIENGASGSGRIFFEMPSLNIVGRECSTFGDLQKTLQQLGINNGTALIRLSFKKTEQPFEEAITEIGEYFKEESAIEHSGDAELQAAPVPAVSNITEAVARLSSAEPSSSEEKDTGIISQDTSQGTSLNPTPYPETVRDDPLPVTPSKRPAPVSEDEPILELNQRRIEVYLPPSSDTPKAALAPHNEIDYEPTVGHLQSAQGRLQSSSQNKRLLSDAEIERKEEEKAAKLSAVKELQIKVRLADQSLAIATLYTTDNAAILYGLVKSAIVAEDQPFKLVWTDNKGTRTIPKDEKKGLIKDLGFSERMLVNFHWEDGASASARKVPTLKPEILKKAKELQVPEVVMTDVKENESGPSVDKGKGKEGESGGGGSGGKIKGKIPSWLVKGLSKK
jgi:tether containing UBX domain for GLUT4